MHESYSHTNDSGQYCKAASSDSMNSQSRAMLLPLRPRHRESLPTLTREQSGVSAAHGSGPQILRKKTAQGRVEVF